MKVLIADDDVEITRMISFFLEASGFEISAARDCVQVQMFARHSVDAILLDVHLPGGTGVDTLKKLKRSPQTKNIPVLMISADPNPDLPRETVAIGAADFLPKPIDLDRLLASLRASLQLTDLGKTTATPTAELSGPVGRQNPEEGILVAEDDPFHRRILEKFLPSWGYSVQVVGDGEAAARALLAEGAPRLALLDWMMPGLDGPAVCRRVRQQSGRPYTYIVLLTAKGQKKDLLEGMESGADDYLVKPFDAQELQARLRTGKRILQLQKELLQAQEELRHQATHDALTKIPNRAAILDALHRGLAQDQREQRPTGAILADIDDFKKLNDTYGHQAGDAALREVSRRLASVVRAYDRVGRYGGEEFLVVAHNCGEVEARSLAERLRLCVSETPVLLPEGKSIQITLSLGVATSPIAQACHEEQLIAAADLALYSAKRAGRNRVEMSSQPTVPAECLIVAS